jgi:hypothetical protein
MNKQQNNSEVVESVVLEDTTTSELESAVRTAVESLSVERLTMYKLANVLSQFTTSRVREQMMYNYCAKNRFAKYDVVDKRITIDSAVAFIVKFVERQRTQNDD